MNSETLLKMLQANIAQRCIGNSAVRGQPSGTLRACRDFFSRLHFECIPDSSPESFNRWLNHQTSRLRSKLPHEDKPWGIARKTLNLFLRDVVDNGRLSREYHLAKIQKWLEVPLDSIVAKRLREAAPGDLPPWPNLTKLDWLTSREYQQVASRLARKHGIDRVDLDLIFWTKGRKKGGK